jgi:hypothetical protein
VEDNEYAKLISSTKTSFDWTMDNVLKRGYDNIFEEYDDYSLLLEKYEFRKMVSFEIYENYFTPRRHEFDLQIISDLVEAVTKYNALKYLGDAVLTGVVGSTVYDLLKNLIGHAKKTFIKKDKNRAQPYGCLLKDISKVEKYFKKKNKVTVTELVGELNIESERLIPILKLLGYKSKKSKDKKIWYK